MQTPPVSKNFNPSEMQYNTQWNFWFYNTEMHAIIPV